MNRILFLLIFCTFALSETILIPEDYTTIQAGIDASSDGDTVLVADGDYVENLIKSGNCYMRAYECGTMKRKELYIDSALRQDKGGKKSTKMRKPVNNVSWKEWKQELG